MEYARRMPHARDAPVEVPLEQGRHGVMTRWVFSRCFCRSEPCSPASPDTATHDMNAASTGSQRSVRVAEVPAGGAQPFHLPQTGGERELRVKVCRVRRKLSPEVARGRRLVCRGWLKESPLGPGRCHRVAVCQVGHDWERSAAFPVDSVGEYTLRLTRRVDLGRLKHISTRRSSEYDVRIPKMEVGQAARRCCAVHVTQILML